MTEDDRLLTRAEVAAMFRVNARTVKRWVDTGRLAEETRTPGGFPRYLESEALRLLASRGGNSS